MEFRNEDLLIMDNCFIIEKHNTDGNFHVDTLFRRLERSDYQNRDWKVIATFETFEDTWFFLDSIYKEKEYGTQRNVPDKLRFITFQRDNYKCVLCNKSAADGARLEADHIIPYSRGGKTLLSNLQTLCRECNNGKSNTLL